MKDTGAEGSNNDGSREAGAEARRDTECDGEPCDTWDKEDEPDMGSANRQKQK